VGTARFEPATSCLQSQIGQDRYLGAQGSPQVAVGVALSVVVRSGPAMTGVNGTVVARTTRTTFMGLASKVPSRPLGEARPPATPASLAS
jgi:hypothetical protein